MPRHITRRILASAVASAIALLSPSFAMAAESCAQDTRLSGPCFTVRGRLSAYNGTPGMRIWVVGTSRILGIGEGRFAPDGYDFLPPNMPQSIDTEAFYFGNYTVCPFTKDTPGVMRLVCVQAVTGLRVDNQQSAASNKSLERASGE